MTLDEKVKQVAIEEVLHQSFALTKQYLSVNTIQLENGVPVIEDIFFDTDGAQVYFPIVDEKYFLVVYVNIDHDLIVRWIGMTAGNEVYLRVTSQVNTLDELLSIIDIVPTTQADNGFTFSLSSKRTGEVEDKLTALLQGLSPMRIQLHRLANIADAEVTINYYGYKDQMWGIHLNHDILQRLSELHLSLDIDLYASGPDLPGE